MHQKNYLVLPGGGACLLSSSLLFRDKYMRYLVAFWCMFFMSILTLDFGRLSLLSLFIEYSCVATLTPTMMVMKGFTFQPLFCRVLISGSYLVCLCLRAWLRNMFWQYVNPMN